MYEKKRKGWLKHLDFMVIDCLSLQIAYLFGCLIWQEGRLPYAIQINRNMAIIFPMIQVVITFFCESFKNVLRRNSFSEFLAAGRHACLVFLAAAFYLFITQNGGNYSRLLFVFTGFAYFCLTCAGRNIWKKLLKRWRKNGNGCRSLLILTTSEMIDVVQKQIERNFYEGFLLTGIAVLESGFHNKKLGNVPVVADAGSVVEYVCREWVDAVFVDLPPSTQAPPEIIEGFSEMGVTIHTKLYQRGSEAGRKHSVERLGGFTVLTSSMNMAGSGQMALKRALDVAGGVTGCLITGILYLFLAPCIYLQSPGPVFFSQVRVGENGKKFKMYKFRSMYMDAEERKKELMDRNRVSDGRMFKIDHDPRIIGGEKGIGGLMRKYSLDEWPQMWNVLKGDMSLVGTRPPTVDEWEKYELRHRARLAVKPGVTGLWQVSGRSDITDFETVVNLDRQYILDWNFKLDIKILFRTVGAVFGRNGAM